jgi:two-component system LytT family response regulator
MNLRILIADDESLSRKRLRQFLRAEPDTEVVAECASGTEAVEAIRQQSPDLVFLDIRMPELDGFGVLEACLGAREPAVIFVTGHDHYAVRAFEAHAIDYLLKPFDRERLQLALRRARQRLRHGPKAPLDLPFAEVLAALEVRPPGLERVTIKSEGRISLVPTSEIDWISGADNYVELHAGKATHLLRTTITRLADQLPSGRFARISRSVLVNLERIREICPKSHGDYLVVLHNGTRLSGSRNYRQDWEGLLG